MDVAIRTTYAPPGPLRSPPQCAKAPRPPARVRPPLGAAIALCVQTLSECSALLRLLAVCAPAACAACPASRARVLPPRRASDRSGACRPRPAILGRPRKKDDMISKRWCDIISTPDVKPRLTMKRLRNVAGKEAQR